MQHAELGYRPEGQDPSVVIETVELVAKVIDNTGLTVADSGDPSVLGRYGGRTVSPISHPLGFHGVRALYSKTQRRNVVAPFLSCLGLRSLRLQGIANDPADERAAWSEAGGWPVRLQRDGRGAALTLAPMPQTRFAYRLGLQPAEPDCIDFSIRFTLGRRPESGPCALEASWACYVNAGDDVVLYYPSGPGPAAYQWSELGRAPDLVLGDPVGYVHREQEFTAEAPVAPVAYGRIGEFAFALMFNDPSVGFRVVDTGARLSFSPAQNPAWLFDWSLADYPLDEPVGFDGRLVYLPYESPEQILRLYRDWLQERTAS